MNKTNRTFKKRLEKEYNQLFNSHSDSFMEYCKKHLAKDDLYILFSICKSIDEVKLNYPKIYEKYITLLNEHKAQNTALTNSLDELSNLLEVFNKGKPNKIYELAKKYLTKYEFTEEQQTEVMAFIFNNFIKHILNIDTKKKEEVINATIIKFKNPKTPKIIHKLRSKKYYDEALKLMLNYQTNCHNLRSVINEDGDIIPFQYATDLGYIIERNKYGIDRESFLDILSLSEKRYYDGLEQEKIEAEKKDKERQKRQEQLEKQHNFMNEQENLLKYQKEAARTLKQFIVDEQPIKYITSDDLVVINNALNFLCFTDEAIMRIQKNIIANNRKFENDELLRKFEEAKRRYLSGSELDTLSQAETIIAENTTSKNPLYASIFNNYQFVKEQLLKVINLQDDNSEEFKEEVELIIIGIADLSTAISSFNMSDYNFVLNRTQTEN